jgi:peroxiredoxin
MSRPFILTYMILWAVVVLQGMLLLGTVRVIHTLQTGTAAVHPTEAEPEVPEEPVSERLIGEQIPNYTTVDISGERFELDQLRGRSTVMLFVSPSCPSCLLALEEVNTVGRKANGNVVVVCGAKDESCRRLANDFGLTVPVIVDESDELQRLFDVSGSPTAVLLNPSNRVVSYGHAVRDGEIQSMMNGEASAAAVK